MKLRTAILLTALGMLTLVVIAVVVVRVSDTGDDVGDFLFGGGDTEPTATRTPRPTATPVPGPSKTALEVERAAQGQRPEYCVVDDDSDSFALRQSPVWDADTQLWVVECTLALTTRQGERQVFLICLYIDDRTLELSLDFRGQVELGESASC